MPKLRKEDVADIDVEALESIEYSTEEFDTYTGEIPEVGTELTGFVKRMWWTRTAPKPNGGGDDPMIKVLWVAGDNDGDNEEFNGCPFWLNAPLIAGAKFRWAPFLEVYGLTLRDIKTKTYVASNEDQNGALIERIGTWKPGEDSDEAWCRIISGTESYNGSLQARVREWLPWDEVEDEEPEDEEPEDEEPEDEEPEDEEPEDEEEPAEPAPPARGRAARTAAKPARTAPARTAPARAAKPAPATTRTRTASRAAPARTAPARSGRGARAKDDPPF